MKPRFAVVWFNRFFGQNKWSVKECKSLAEAYIFVDNIERMMKACGYKMQFRIKTTVLKGGEHVDQIQMQNR